MESKAKYIHGLKRYACSINFTFEYKIFKVNKIRTIKEKTKKYFVATNFILDNTETTIRIKNMKSKIKDETRLSFSIKIDP